MNAPGRPSARDVSVYHRYYLPNADSSGTVSMVDTEGDQGTADVAVGGVAWRQIAVDAGGEDFYVINKVGGSVTVADAATGRVSESLGVGAQPKRIALAMDRVLVLNENGAAPDSLSVVESKEHQRRQRSQLSITTRISLTTLTRPTRSRRGC